MAGTLGTDNPFRYRGYVYDEETGLYYLQSRYYNPEWGRFLNADIILGQPGKLLSHNVFAYCRNNPVNRLDRDGMEDDDSNHENVLSVIGDILEVIASALSDAFDLISTYFSTTDFIETADKEQEIYVTIQGMHVMNTKIIQDNKDLINSGNAGELELFDLSDYGVNVDDRYIDLQLDIFEYLGEDEQAAIMEYDPLNFNHDIEKSLTLFGPGSVGYKIRAKATVVLLSELGKSAIKVAY